MSYIALIERKENLYLAFRSLITSIVVAVLPVPGIPEIYKLELEPLFLRPCLIYSTILSLSFSLQGSLSGMAESWSLAQA